MSSMKYKLYIDNCCFNRPFDDQKQIRIRIETEAKPHIQQKIVQGEFQLAWSYILDYENFNNPFSNRRHLITRWKYKAFTHVLENKTIIKNGLFLEKNGIRPKDALHVACSVEAGCDYFVTTDDGIIKKMKDLNIIKTISPIELINITED